MLRVPSALLLAAFTSSLSGQEFLLSAPRRAGSPGQVIRAPILLDNPQGVVGFSLAITHDPSVVELVGIEPGATTRDADQFLVDLAAVGLNGQVGGTLVVRVDLDVPPLDVIVPAIGNEIAIFEYLVRGSPGESTPLDFCDCLGDPLVTNRLTLMSTSLEPPQASGSLDVADVFQRGDANDDGIVDGSDAAFLSRWLFGVGPAATCEDTGDVNDDGVLQGAVDTLFLLSFLFQNGPPIPPPVVDCGVDATPDPLGCLASDSCP